MLQSKQFNDRQGGGFFLRLHFSAPHEIEELRQAFGAVAESFRMTWRLNDTASIACCSTAAVPSSSANDPHRGA
ncbi:MAG: formyltetrahydrofolate deformylase [Actinomycetia bacterium]|jgi:formyltetrahydrofolate deformylase|nr:formyltetrahydrofolate deformylase [Actinomycetes bacterium]